MIRFTSNTFAVEAAGPDGEERRTITGIAVPYNTFATVSDGTTVQFAPGSLPVEGKAPRLYMYHDSTQPVGLVAERVDSPEAMYFTAKVSNTRAGDEALVLAADGVIDSVSVGVNPTEFKYDDEGNMTILAADWVELSLVPTPAFAGATISQVAAEAPQVETPKEEPKMETSPAVVEETVIPTAPIFAQAKREPRLPNAFEFMAAIHKGGIEAANANKVWEDYRAYHKSPIEAAAGDVTSTNVGGIVPLPLLGPVFADINYISPLLTAVGTRAMPGGGTGATFIRPTWTTHPTVAEQAAQFDAVSATTSVIAANTVTKKSFAGATTLSYQTVDFTDPAAMAVIMQDLAGQYLRAIDNFACDNLVTAASSDGVWDLTVADLLKSIYDCAVTTVAATNFLPTHIAVDPATWGLMMQLTDDQKRPIFGYTGGGLNAFNAIGNGGINAFQNANPLGLQIVVDNNFAAKTMVIFNSNAYEIYRQDRGLLSVENPSTISRTMSMFGYAATFAANSSMIRKITQA
jgi:HK97 family phage prohead protease